MKHIGEKIIAGYIRVSTEQQVDRDSLINQEEAIKRYALQSGKPYKIYRDGGISAKNKDRPALQKLLKDAEKGLIDTVAVTKLDRITRSLKDLIDLHETFARYDVRFVSLTQNLDTSSPIGRFSFHLLGIVAQLERETTAERVSDDMKARAARGMYNGGVVQFGYTTRSLEQYKYLLKVAEDKLGEKASSEELREYVKVLKSDKKTELEAKAYAAGIIPAPKTLFVNEKEAGIVRIIFELFNETGSIRGTCDRLNSLGYRTRSGDFWTTTSVRRLLTNPIYKGDLVYNKRTKSAKTSRPRSREEYVVAEGAVASIISDELFEKTQKLILQNRAVPSSARKGSYLLSGLVRCGFCGGKMHASRQVDKRKEGQIYRYYRCNTNLHKGKSACPGNSIDMDYLEQSIIGELRRLRLNPERLKDRISVQRFEMQKNAESLNARMAELERELERIDAKVRRLLILFEDELIGKEEFAGRRKELIEVKSALVRELSEIERKKALESVGKEDIERAIEKLGSFADIYDELDFDERKRLLRSIIGEVIVGKDRIDYSIVIPVGIVDIGERMLRGSWQRPA